MIANLVLLTFSYSICKTCCHHHRWRSIYMCPLFFFLSSLSSSLYTNLTLTGLSIVNISRSTMWALIWTQSIDTFALSGTIVFSWYTFINIYTEWKKSKLKTLQDGTPRPTLWKWPCVSVYFSFCSSSCLSFSHLLSQDSFACSPVFSPWCCTNNFLEIIAA